MGGAAAGVFVLSVLCATQVQGGGGSSPPRLGVTAGWFKPNTLAAQASVSPFDSVASAPCCGVQLATPEFSGTTLRLSGGLWTWRNHGPLTMVPLALDVKHDLIQGLPFRPYVVYGGAVYWGWEGRWRDVARRGADARGWGATLGVGLDVHLSRHWSLAVEFDYLYVMFKRELGGARDYSGPRLVLGMNYGF